MLLLPVAATVCCKLLAAALVDAAAESAAEACAALGGCRSCCMLCAKKHSFRVHELPDEHSTVRYLQENTCTQGMIRAAFVVEQSILYGIMVLAYDKSAKSITKC